MSFALAGPVVLGSMECSPTLFRRSQAQADSSDQFFFNPMTAGWQVLSFQGTSTRFDAGEGCLMHLSDAGDCLLPEGGSALGVRIDAGPLRALVKHPEDLLGKPIRRNHPGMALLMGYLRSFTEAGPDLTPQLRYSFGLHVIDLVAAILGTSREASVQTEAGGIRAARLQRVLDRIANRACDPQFGVDTVAAELRVTSRTIQLLLEETGSSFSEHVCEQRLRRARQLLTGAASRLSIAEIAYEAGFNDVSHFYRAFRRRFGETPASARNVGPRMN